MLNFKITPTSKNIAAIIGVAIFFLFDRWLKTVALGLTAGSYQRLASDLFIFRFSANYRIAFSLPISGPALPLAVLIVIVALAIYANRIPKKPGYQIERLAIGMIIMGAISNLIDRLAYGYVVDYLELRYFTVFNLADTLITVGAAILIFRSIRSR